MQFGDLALKRCRYGWMLYGGAYIGRCFDLYGQYSESEVSLMRSFVREGNTVIDVGANIGDLTVPLSQIVGNSGRVYALESHPEVFNVLCANLALNGIRNTRPINAFVATGDRAETDGGDWGRAAFVGENWRPDFLALDSLDLEACHFIKVDVDGKELEVLRSGEMHIERFRPVLYFENDIRESSAELLSYAMDRLGYDLYWQAAPIFEERNFFGNPVNHWAPQTIISQMIVGLPSERKTVITNLKRVSDPTEWWDALT
jgi:Methyltransferase FkbM domain